MSKSKTAELDTLWRVPDALWETISKALAVYDPPNPTGRPRINQRLAMGALI